MAVFDANALIYFRTEKKKKKWMTWQQVWVKKKMLNTYISSVDKDVRPTAKACCLPSAITAYY